MFVSLSLFLFPRSALLSLDNPSSSGRTLQTQRERCNYSTNESIHFSRLFSDRPNSKCSNNSGKWNRPAEEHCERRKNRFAGRPSLLLFQLESQLSISRQRHSQMDKDKQSIQQLLQEEINHRNHVDSKFKQAEVRGSFIHSLAEVFLRSL